MAKHQITLVGGQILPIYFGIKEFSPDHIHFIVSAESKGKSGQLKSLVGTATTTEYTCDPYQVGSVTEICKKIIEKLSKDDTVLFNLTGGNKVMLFGAQAVMIENSMNGFYINQNEKILCFPDMTEQLLTCLVSIKEFIQITGHKLKIYKTLGSIPPTDLKAADAIYNFAINYDKPYLKIQPALFRTFNGYDDIPPKGFLLINANYIITWSEKNLRISISGRDVLNISAPGARELLFRASWWELVIAQQISKWAKLKEMLIQCELPFKDDELLTKNEIDILLNVGRKMIFVECKSGKVKQEDINKMRIVKDTYGGFIAKSILVCRHTQQPGILEKCKELDIEVCTINSWTPKNTLINVLDKLNRRLNI